MMVWVFLSMLTQISGNKKTSKYQKIERKDKDPFPSVFSWLDKIQRLG
jgi:hypothetical protein